MGKWNVYYKIEEYDFEYDIEYNEDLGMYRISLFKDLHFRDEITFDEKVLMTTEEDEYGTITNITWDKDLNEYKVLRYQDNKLVNHFTFNGYKEEEDNAINS